MTDSRPRIIVIWRQKSMDGDAAWHIREFRNPHTATNFTASQRSRSDLEFVQCLNTVEPSL